MLDGAPTCLRLSITSITPSLVIKYLPWLLALQANLIDLVADIKCITDISPCLPGAKAVAQMVELLKQERTKKSTRDLCILRFLYDLGLKRAEVVSIDVEDIDLERGEIWVKGKGRPPKERFSLPKPTLRALTMWLDARGESAGPLFTNLDRAHDGGRLSPSSIYRIIRDLGERPTRLDPAAVET